MVNLFYIIRYLIGIINLFYKVLYFFQVVYCNKFVDEGISIFDFVYKICCYYYIYELYSIIIIGDIGFFDGI